MRGVFKLLWLPAAATSLLLMGCGVPIAPEAITATAEADRQEAPADTSVSGRSPTFFNDTASSLQSTSPAVGADATPVDSPAPLPTLASITEPTATPTLEAASEPDAGDTDETQDTAEATETPEAAETPDGTEVAASETPVETPAATATPEPTATSAPVVTQANPGFASEFLALLNAQRTGRGMNALTLNATISAGATQYAGYMGLHNYFGHYPDDGSTPPSRLAASGYPGAYNGEALSAGQPTPQLALNALLASPSHADILLDPTSVEVGIGYAYVLESRYRHYWVVVTGIP